MANDELDELEAAVAKWLSDLSGRTTALMSAVGFLLSNLSSDQKTEMVEWINKCMDSSRQGRDNADEEFYSGYDETMDSFLDDLQI